MTDLLADIEPEELNDSKLAWSSIECVYNPTRKRGGGRSITKCLFCGSEWKTGGPRDIRAHLDPGSVRYRAVCIPKPEHADRFAKVSKEVQERRRKKEVEERKRKSPVARISEGLADLGASSSPSSSSSLSEPERAALIEECDQAWARSWAKNAWAFRAVDCPYFREALRLSAILGDDYLIGKSKLGSGKLRINLVVQSSRTVADPHRKMPASMFSWGKHDSFCSKT